MRPALIRIDEFRDGATFNELRLLPQGVQRVELRPNPGRAENISDGGLMLTLTESLPRRTRLTIVVPTWPTIPPVKAQVMWTQTAPDGEGILHGLHFLSDDTRKELFIVGALLRQFADQNEAASGKQEPR